MIDDAISLLGRPARDKVTDFAGIVSSVSFDLYGCVQVALTPRQQGASAEVKHGAWFDIGRLDVDYDAERVMPVPDFARVAVKATEYTHGAAVKLPL